MALSPFGPAQFADPPAAPVGTLDLSFWRGLAQTPGALGRMLAAPVIRAKKAGQETLEDALAALDVIGGGEDPATKKPAGKPKYPANPVPATSEARPVQQPGPANTAPSTVEPETMPMGVPMPIDEPPAAPTPGVVKIRLADGREFDYGAGESLPQEEQGRFGAGHFEQGYNMGQGAGTLESYLGGTGHPGGIATGVTPESRLARAKEEGAITQAEYGMTHPYPEITAKEEAETRTRVAQENARRGVDRDRLSERLKAEQEAQVLIEQNDQWRTPREANITRWEEHAAKTGNPEDAKRAAALREAFDRESAARQSKLNQLLAAKGLLRGTLKVD